MEEFFKDVPFDAALDIEAAGKAIYDLREQRGAILARLGVDDEATLLERLSRGELTEHPGYEHYLSASILNATREALRQQLASALVHYNQGRTGGAAEGSGFEFSPVFLKPQIEAVCASDLDGDVAAMQDALLFKLTNGVTVELRVLSPHHYCFSWLWGDAVMRIDTAPNPAARGNAPSHFHDVDGGCLADPITVPGAAPITNICRLVRALVANPLLVA